MGKFISTKIEADYLIKITASFLRKHGFFLVWGRSGRVIWTSGDFSEQKNSIGIEVSVGHEEEYLRIYHMQTNTDTGKKMKFDYKIPLTTTPCYFGGKRYWFVCPWIKNWVYCDRRVGVLYKGGNYFACRHCYNLTYASRKISHLYRFDPSFVILNTDKKIEQLETEIKRRYYAGKPTKKQRKLERLYRKIEMDYQLR